MNDNNEYCPHCNANLQGEPIPESSRTPKGSTHFTRKIGMTTVQADRILYWQCPDCNDTWDRNEIYRR